MDYEHIIKFWFEEAGPSKWYVADAAFDQEIYNRFSDLHDKAAKGELFSWRSAAQGALAEIIILDQFSRNMFRNTAQAFAYDGMALILSQNMVQSGQEKELPDQMRSVLYLPYMHSESLRVHEEAVKLYHELGLAEPIKFEKMHFDIIQEFGRYPYRNKILGRVSTLEEKSYLEKNPNGF